MEPGANQQKQLKFAPQPINYLTNEGEKGLLSSLLPTTAAQDGQIAQLVEQRTENPRVHSSILCLATIFYPTRRKTPSFMAVM